MARFLGVGGFSRRSYAETFFGSERSSEVGSGSTICVPGFSEGIRLDFNAGKSGSDQGAVWVIRKDSRIAAVQYSGTGSIDEALRTSIEHSLTLN